MVLTAVVLGWLLLRRLTLPLSELSGAARAISQRNLAQDIPPAGSDEVGELRTPVTLLSGELEAIREGIYTADAATLDSLHQEVALLAKLVEDLSVVAAADARELGLELEFVDARHLLGTTAKRNSSKARAAGVQFEVDAPKGLTVRADATRILQVLSNLVTNSLRHGGSLTRIRLSAARETDTTIEFRVQDDGKGVDEADLPFLFDRLYRAERSRGRGGSGLGLSISNSIVEARGGEIRALPADPKGFLVAFWLPL